jgi:hypothetical protein
MNPDGTLKKDNSYLQTAMDTARSASAITLHGWIAVLSILSSIFVVVAGAYWLLKRATGLEKPHTTFVRREYRRVQDGDDA